MISRCPHERICIVSPFQSFNFTISEHQNPGQVNLKQSGASDNTPASDRWLTNKFFSTYVPGNVLGSANNLPIRTCPTNGFADVLTSPLYLVFFCIFLAEYDQTSFCSTRRLYTSIPTLSNHKCSGLELQTECSILIYRHTCFLNLLPLTSSNHYAPVCAHAEYPAYLKGAR